MYTLFVSVIFIVIGLLLILFEIIFSFSLFNHAASVGFILTIAGVLLFSIRTIKRSKKVKRKHYDQLPGSVSGYFPYSKKHSNDAADYGVSGSDFSAGGGDGG